MPRWEVWSANGQQLLATFGPGGAPYLRAQVRADRTADCRYAATLVVPNQDGRWDQNAADPGAWVFAENNVLKCYADDGTPRFWGLIDDAPSSRSADGMPVIEVHARSIEKRLLQECFTDTTSYVDTPSESANWASSAQGASASASSYLAAGQSLQRTARVAGLKGRRQVLGLWQAASPHPETRALQDGTTATTYEWAVTERGLAVLEMTITLDLWTQETLQRIEAIVPDGTRVTRLRTSGDGFTWTERSHPAVNVSGVRYVELTFEARGNGTVRLRVHEISLVAGAAYPPSAAIDGDEFTSWRPATTDLTRQFTVSFGQARTFNAVYLSFGVHPLDVADVVQFRLYADGRRIYDGTDRWYSGLVEVALASDVTASALTLEIVGRTGLVAVRHIEVLKVTANQNRVSWLLSDLATHAGIPAAQQAIQPSWLWRANLTARLGDPYWRHVQEVAQAVGWEVYGRPDGVLVAGPVILDAAHPVATLTAITGVERRPPQDVRNYVVVISEQPDKTIRADAKDDSAGSPTSIQRLGNRVEVIQDDTILTDKAAQQRAVLELWQRSRWRAELTVSLARPAEVEPGDVVRVDGEPGVYLVQGYTREMEPGVERMQVILAPLEVGISG